MTGEEKQVEENGNVLVVGLKLDNTGRELLTWILAKFTQAGDRLIAVHVAPSTSRADMLRSKLESTDLPPHGSFDSISGVYDNFCSIKQVDLQVKVANGPSLRRALIEEAKRSNAVKLILGHASIKTNIAPSFSLAKNCLRRLPSTCSVVVIQHGQVAFEKEGSLKNLGENNSGVLNTIQKTLRSHSWKHSGHQPTDGRRANVACKSFVTEMGHGEYGNAACPCPLPPSPFLDSPVSVLHTYKHPLSQKRYMDPLERPFSASSSPTESAVAQNKCGTSLPSQGKVLHSHQNLEECIALSERKKDHSRSLSPVEKTTSTQSVQVMQPQPKEQKEVEHSNLCMSIPRPTNGPYSRESVKKDGIPPLVGWPLLHKHFPSNQDHNKPGPCKLSVVEWALQLPNRPKEMVAHQAELLKLYNKGQNPLPQISRESIYHEQQRTEKSATLPSQSHADALGVRIAKLSSMTSCKQFQLKELQAATSNFNSDNMVGRGGCSQVFQGVLSDGYTVAVKCFNASAIDSEDELATEVEIMCNLRHRHIVQLIGYCVDNQHRMLVYNFASQGNLEQKLHGKAVLPWGSRYNIAIGVANALNYLHECCPRPVIHRDVKSSNILLLEDLEPQLTDFGLAKWMPVLSMQLTCSDVVGTFGYLAPEYFMFGKVSEKTDVYSFGVVLLELITGRRPIDSTRPKGEANLVVWARSLLEDESSAKKLIDPKLDGSYDYGQLKDMMITAALCLQQSSKMRPRMRRILKLLRGEVEDLEHVGRQDSVSKESDDGYDIPNYGEIDIKTHLTLALLGLDDDTASQASIEHSVNLAHSNKYLEEYLGDRYSRSSSFE